MKKIMKNTHIITHPIVYTATRLEAVANRFVFGPMGTTAASMKILGLLLAHGSLTPRRIVELGGGTKSNVSQRLNHLEKKKYIARAQDAYATDRRKVQVRLTQAGKNQVAEVRKRMKKAQICLAKCFNEKEIIQHVKFLEKINFIIDKEERNLDTIFNG